MAPVLNCDGWEITTVEGLGTEVDIHPVQERLSVFNGTQCGYCSPGMVMQMNRYVPHYCLLLTVGIGKSLQMTSCPTRVSQHKVNQLRPLDVGGGLA